MSDETKICDNCDAVIGKAEKLCPKCQVDTEELEELVSSVERANQIAEKRRKRNAPAPAPAPEVKQRESVATRLRGLGKAFRK
jgi:RNA polymerase subunit RPABC4/transcription elongation factor Spt4